MRKRFWPAIPDRTTARQLANRAAGWYVIVAVISGIFAAISVMSGGPITRGPSDPTVVYSALSFVDTALFAWIAYKVRSMSSGWAIAGLALLSVSVVLSLFSSPLALLIETPIMLRLIHGVRATRAWDRLNNPAPTNWVSSSFPAGQA